MRPFLNQIPEFKQNPDRINEWAKGLSISEPMLYPTKVSVDAIREAIESRESAIKVLSCEFARVKAEVRGRMAWLDVSLGSL
jgi:hypothetical protein